MFPFSYVYPSATSVDNGDHLANLYNQIEMSLVIVEGGRGVRPDDVLSVDLSANRDMLTNG
jgi:hypothetical protein